MPRNNVPSTTMSRKVQDRGPPAPKKGAIPVELQVVRRNGMEESLLQKISDVCSYCTTNFRRSGGRGGKGGKVRVADWERWVG